MAISDDIHAARNRGVLHCGVSKHATVSLEELAREFGLLPISYTEIDAESAHALASDILHRDLAYGVEIMPAMRAKELAAAFLAQFKPAPSFFTNGTFHKRHATTAELSWTPATGAEFDTGVLILAPDHSGCLWVEDTA